MAGPATPGSGGGGTPGGFYSPQSHKVSGQREREKSAEKYKVKLIQNCTRKKALTCKVKLKVQVQVKFKWRFRVKV